MIIVLVFIVLCVQVILQTYIEYLRGKVEDKKEMNHHGKTIVVDTATKVEPLEYVTDKKTKLLNLFISGNLRLGQSMNKFSRELCRICMTGGLFRVLFTLFIKPLHRKSKSINSAKLNLAVFIARKIIPALIISFVSIYWIVGLRAYGTI